MWDCWPSNRVMGVTPFGVEGHPSPANVGVVCRDFDGAQMLSKCANPDCAEKFLFLHLGKLFCLAPTPEIEVSAGALSPLRERFWLCDRCAKMMTIVWDGTKVTLVPLPEATQPKKIISEPTT